MPKWTKRANYYPNYRKDSVLKTRDMYVLYIERSGTRIIKSDASSSARERDSHKRIKR